MKKLYFIKRSLLLLCFSAVLFGFIDPEDNSDFTTEGDFNPTFWGTRCRNVQTYTDDGKTISIVKECCKFRFWINFGDCDYELLWPY